MQDKSSWAFASVLLLTFANLGCEGQAVVHAAKPTSEQSELLTQSALTPQTVPDQAAQNGPSHQDNPNHIARILAKTTTLQAVRQVAPEALDQQVVPEALEKTPDVVFVPTPQPVVDRMLHVAKVTKDDVVYDLGCGDGRILVTAAKRYGTRAYGFDVDPKRVAEAKENVRKNGLEHLVTIQQKDIFTLDLSPASVVTLYLLPELNVKLIPQLNKLKKGARVVSHDFDMKGVRPEQHLVLRPPDVERDHNVYLWRVPLQKE